jgi:hypothetical protein
MFGIDPVILPVSANEAYVADLIRIIDCRYQPVSIAPDVKHDTVLAEDAGIRVCPLNVCGRLPNRCLYIIIPGPETLLGVGMVFPELPQCSPGYDPHE